MNKKKLWFWILWCSIAVAALTLLLYGIYMAGYEYTFYKKYKTVKSAKLLHVYNRQYQRFDIELPLKFTPDEHDADTVQMLLVQAENKKLFMIFRFADGHIQLMAFPYTRYINLKYYDGAYYTVTDSAVEEKLRKLLDTYCAEEEQ